MIVKGTKQLGSFKKGVNLYVPKRNISQPAEQIIWKVAIFGAGTTSSNGEYVWDGTTLVDDKPQYDNSNGSRIYWVNVLNKWLLEDNIDGTDTYNSTNLLSWDIDGGASPAPSSALSYAQDSFISSITLVGAGTTSSNGTYARSSGGTETPFTSGSNQIFYDAGRWVVEDNVFGDFVYESDGTIFNWTVFNGDSPAPSVSAITYSA